MAFWWRAIYDDGSVFEEVAGSSSEQIDRDRLRRFEIRNGAADVIALEDLGPDRRLVFRRRTDIVAGVPGDIACLLGWHDDQGLHIWRVTETSPPVPEPMPDIQLVPCELLNKGAIARGR